MASEVGICNRALDKIGAGPIISLDDPNKRAQACKRMYADLRDAEIRDTVWGFAITRAQVPADLEPPLFGFARQFTIPSDSLRIIEIADATGLVFFSFTPFHLNGRFLSGTYSIESNKILTDFEAPLDIRYVKRVTDPNQMDSLFREALAARIAVELAEIIAQSDAKKALAKQDYEDLLGKAVLTDGAETPDDGPQDHSWFLERF